MRSERLGELVAGCETVIHLAFILIPGHDTDEAHSINQDGTENCEWCLDFGSSISGGAGVSEEELRELPTYETSDRFSELEKLVLDYATGISRSPVTVPAELFDRLRGHLDEAQLVELASIIALENYRARFNWAFGIEAQGFSDGAFCVPPQVRGHALPARSGATLAR